MPLGAARFNTLSAAGGGFDGSFALIEARSISAGIQTFDLSTDYIYHEFHLQDIWSNSSYSFLGGSVSSDGGSTLLTGGYDYKFLSQHPTSNGTVTKNRSNVNNWYEMCASRKDSSRNGISGYIRIMNFESSTRPTYITEYLNQPTGSSGGYNNISFGSGSKNGTHNAFALGDYQMSSGLLASGYIYHYGLKTA
jgi:hypothetical protein